MSISAGDSGFARESAGTRPGIPDPGGALHIASLEYDCTFGQLSSSDGRAGFILPDPCRFQFAFETGSTAGDDGTLVITWDYSWFDQATVEADIAYALRQIVVAVAQMLGLTIGEVNQAVLIRRVWTYAPNVQGPGTGSGRIVTSDVIPYPPQASREVVFARSFGRVAVAISAADAARAKDVAYGFGGDWATAAESGSVS